jgi:DNA-binding NtrC family response regulator
MSAFQKKILIVDDEQDFLNTLVQRLQKRALDAEGVQSGEDCLTLLNQKDFDVVVLDVRMPGGMDGIETLREIKKVRPLTEVILLTGYASLETGIQGMKMGAFDYLQKPVDLEKLLSKLAKALNRKEDHQKRIRRGEMQIKDLRRYLGWRLEEKEE